MTVLKEPSLKITILNDLMTVVIYNGHYTSQINDGYYRTVIDSN